MQTRTGAMPWVLVAVSIGMAPRAEAAGKCELGGGPAVIVMTDIDCDSTGSALHGKGGQGEVWKGPPPFLPSEGTLEFSSRFRSGPWIVGATADFNRDGECDIVWYTDACGEPQHQVILTITSPSGIVVPAPATMGKNIPAAWSLVGSGDFVCAPGLECDPAAADGAPDLVWWDAALRQLWIWGSDGAGGFPESQRFLVPGPIASGATPVAVAEIDGVWAAFAGGLPGRPEIIWFEYSNRLTIWHLERSADGSPTLSASGFLMPAGPTPGSKVRGASDLNGDGGDDLIYQNTCTDLVVVEYWEGYSHPLQPLFHGLNKCSPDGGPHWQVVGPR